MSDIFERPPARSSSTGGVRARLEEARTAGGWMPWAGAGLAAAGWLGVAAWIYTAVGIDLVMAQPPLVIAGGFAVFLVPGLALIVAGIMARESRRSAEANALVLASARLLMEPADNARSEISTIAEAVKAETANVTRALTETRSRMDGLKNDIEQSVTAALKASEIVRADSEVLIQKMGSERTSMSQLADTLRNQAEHLSKSIPRHAQMMSEAARTAQEEVRKAEETLDTRLRHLEDTARRLAERIDQLDTMGAESRKRAQNLAGALMRLDEQLVQSTRMVEAAMKAGELAAEASKGTATSLRDAMSDALDSALRVSDEVHARSAEATEQAQSALVRLREAGLQAEATTRAASMAAKAQADETERRVNELSEFMFRAANKASQITEGGLDQARERIEKATALVGRFREEAHEDHRPTSIDDLVLESSRSTELLRQKPTASSEFNASLREAAETESSIEKHLAALSKQPPAGAPPQMPPERAPAPPTAAKSDLPPLFPEERKPGLSWRDLLTGIEETPPQEEVSAREVIGKLEQAGVRLSVVKASDLRRIASAAHQGERPRRRATRDIAPSEIQRVSRLLDADQDLQRAAKSFVTMEEPDALRILAGSDRAREEASTRLSAYLLLDAALGTQI